MLSQAKLLTAALWVLFCVACAGETAEMEEEEAEPAAASTPAEAEPAAEARGGQVEVQGGDADRGAQLFTEKGCVGCHSIGGGRLVGPDLEGVTERREASWILAMIAKPDSMIRSDSIAKELFSEYMTPMPNQGLTEEEARALQAYLERESE